MSSITVVGPRAWAQLFRYRYTQLGEGYCAANYLVRRRAQGVGCRFFSSTALLDVVRCGSYICHEESLASLVCSDDAALVVVDVRSRVLKRGQQCCARGSVVYSPRLPFLVGGGILRYGRMGYSVELVLVRRANL